jgi:hypothetical protein
MQVWLEIGLASGVAATGRLLWAASSLLTCPFPLNVWRRGFAEMLLEKSNYPGVIVKVARRTRLLVRSAPYQDPRNPKRGWGVFGKLTKADGNSNTLEQSSYFGVGGSSVLPSRPDDRFGVAYLQYGVIG